MDFTIKDINENILGLSRRIGYVILDSRENNGYEYSLVRKLSVNNYPRFHIYLKQRGSHFDFSLHLDQKQPSYKGSNAHSGEYDGPVVEEESERIKELLAADN
jgi:hypothetical protein